MKTGPAQTMTRKFCNFCDAEHFHNQLKPKKEHPPEYRCTNCGHPRRFGNANNNMIRMVPNGRVDALPRG